MKIGEIEKVVKVAADHGIKSVKLTGGEPLLRWDIVEIVKRISEIEGIEEVSMVSNGVLLAPVAKKLKEAGLQRINVSLHSDDPETYEKITGGKREMWKEVIRGIKRSKNAGISVKINIVVLKGINDQKLFDLVRFAEKLGVNVQFIEYHTPYFIRPDFKKFFFSLENFEKELERIAFKTYEREMHRRKRFLLDSGIYVETVRPMFNSKFCANCRRIRVVCYNFKPCLMRNDNLVSFKNAFLSKNPEKEIEKALFEAVRRREPYFR